MLSGSITLPEFIDLWQTIKSVLRDAHWEVTEYGDMIIYTGCYFSDPSQIERWKELLAPA